MAGSNEIVGGSGERVAVTLTRVAGYRRSPRGRQRCPSAQTHAPDQTVHGFILKIETREGFDQLPRLVLAAMQSRAVGVMIARGDLAVEGGYQRLAEVQEEILWICEAAHMPVIWATQALESLAKNRHSLTLGNYAAMGERAECVMLNKGPYIVTAVMTLDDILRRMRSHQEKKRSMLQRLHLAVAFRAGV